MMFKMDVDQDIQIGLLDISDHDVYLELVRRNREHLRQWLPWPDHVQNKDDAIAFIERTRKQWYEHQGFIGGISYKEQLCGIVGFHSINHRQKHASLGYWLGDEFQGKGIMTKVCSFLLQHAFTVMTLHRVEIRTEVDNLKSRALAERLGFTLEGIARQTAIVNRRYVDHAVYSLLSHEWEAIRKSDVGKQGRNA